MLIPSLFSNVNDEINLKSNDRSVIFFPFSIDRSPVRRRKNTLRAGSKMRREKKKKKNGRTCAPQHSHNGADGYTCITAALRVRMGARSQVINECEAGVGDQDVDG
jgi:hypothetical protein